MGEGYNSSMRSPFPGMDPYLEHPALWPDFHNRLIASIADALSPLLRPRYFVALEERTYVLKGLDLEVIGLPDAAVVESRSPAASTPALSAREGRAAQVEDVELPRTERARETYLEVYETGQKRRVVTVLEVLSPANKLHRQGRRDYERKRKQIFETFTGFVEIDLLRDGEPMPLERHPAPSDYRILVSRGNERPQAQLHTFGVRQPIPAFPLPLLPGDTEPEVDLNEVLQGLYERAGYDLRLDYARPPLPPLPEADAEWARGLIEARG